MHDRPARNWVLAKTSAHGDSSGLVVYYSPDRDLASLTGAGLAVTKEYGQSPRKCVILASSGSAAGSS